MTGFNHTGHCNSHAARLTPSKAQTNAGLKQIWNDLFSLGPGSQPGSLPARAAGPGVGCKRVKAQVKAKEPVSQHLRLRL